MQQPSSNYYHFVYGGYAELGKSDSRFVGRLAYIERPRFKSAGFSEQEYGTFASIGTKVTDSKKPYGLSTQAGFGRMQGYIAAEKENADLNLKMRRYAINGLLLNIEANVQFYGVELAISHQNFTGISSRSEAESRVAWPFTFYLLRAGISL